MHSRDLIELAALVAVHAGSLIRHGRLSESGIEQYWLGCKSRLDGWMRRLQTYAQAQQMIGIVDASDAAMIVAWQGVRPVVEEILASEVLTRIWTAVACCVDRRQGRSRAEPIVRSVFLGHLEARHRALNLLVFGRGFNTQSAVDLNRLRRRCERWSDMLLGYIVTDESVDEFSFEPERTREFARDIREELNRPVSPLGWQLVLSSLRSAFKQGMDAESPSAALNEKISASILSCFHSDLFDGTGIMESLWLQRMAHIASDTEGMIEELLAFECDARIGKGGMTSSRF